MITVSSVDSARAYLDAHLSHHDHGQRGRFNSSDGPFVTISRESGSGGSTLAQALAEHLNSNRTRAETDAPTWTVFDQDIVEQVLRERHLPSRIAQFLPEARVSEVASSVGELVGLHPNLWMLVQQTNLLIRELARRGHAIIVGRGANFATDSVPNGLHVRLVAPPSFRATQMAERLKITATEAAVHNRRTDAARRDYVRSLFGANIADPSAYDIIINTGRISFSDAADLLVPHVRARIATAAHAHTHF